MRENEVLMNVFGSTKKTHREKDVGVGEGIRTMVDAILNGCVMSYAESQVISPHFFVLLTMKHAFCSMFVLFNERASK